MAFDSESDIASAMGVAEGPSLYLNEKQYGGIDKLSVGEEVEWTVKGIVQSVSAHGQSRYSKASASATINITEIDGKKATVAEKYKGMDQPDGDYDEDD